MLIVIQAMLVIYIGSYEVIKITLSNLYVDSLVYFMFRIMSSTNNDSFTSFSTYIPFTFLFLPDCTRYDLQQVVRVDIFALFLIRGKTSHPLTIMVTAIDFQQVLLVKWRKFASLLRVFFFFYDKGLLNWGNAVSASIQIKIIFFWLIW